MAQEATGVQPRPTAEPLDAPNNGPPLDACVLPPTVQPALPRSLSVNDVTRAVTHSGGAAMAAAICLGRKRSELLKLSESSDSPSGHQ